jgi:hypothetical protein
MNSNVKKPSADQVKDGLLKRYSEDYFRFQDIQYGLKIIKLDIQSLTLNVEYSFISDPAVHDERHHELFAYDDNFRVGFFPDSLNLITIRETFTWPNLNGIEQFCIDECVAWDEHLLDITNLSWDDPDFPMDVFEWAIEQCGVADPGAIGYTLIHKYDAINIFPEFIPKRLITHFKKWMDEMRD